MRIFFFNFIYYEVQSFKIHHLILDGTKIKAKISINKLTNENQIKIMKEHLQKSIERDQKEDEELGNESGNSVPESLLDKEKLKGKVRNRKIF